MKNGNLYQELKSAKKEDRIAWAKIVEMLKLMCKELNETKNETEKTRIKEKYEKILKKLREERSKKRENLWHIAGIYHDYGSFFTPIVTDFFAAFLSYVEGEKYIPYMHFENQEIIEGSIIIKEEIDRQHDKINYETLDKLYKNGDLILLDTGLSNTVDFYNYIGGSNYKFGNFSYLREFVNRLIQYRIDNDKRNITSITLEDLYSFAGKYLLTHPDLIVKSKDKREQMLMSQSEEVISQYKKLELKQN